ncbi:MAG: aldo/keto reductase, partial [Nitrospira sp.]|nr:aldo/keto reductase [Nitrospira sp.]
ASSLTHLHTDYVDSYVLHGPYSRWGLGESDREVWSAMEELYQTGKTKMIGISNVTAGQLTQLCTEGRIKPMVVQNRCYASQGWDRKVREVCQEHGIIYQGFSLLTANRDVMADPDIRAIANRLGTNPAQVVFRFAMHIGILPLTGTTKEHHMKDDLKTEQLALLPEEIELMDTIAE